MNRWILFCSALLVGCGAQTPTNSCGNKALLLWPKAPGQYHFTDVLLTTLNSPYRLSGPAAKVYYAPGLERDRIEGPIAEPHLTQSGDTCVPMDFASTVAVSAYAQFERLWQFDRELGVADQLSWPRNVLVEMNLRTTDGNTHNNAHYLSGPDAVAVQPYSKDNLPIALNHGIVAHEHFHAHFQHQVLNQINRHLGQMISLARPAEEMEKVDVNSPSGLNNFVLRAWNEGLADLYAGIYTSNATFIGDSLPLFRDRRDLTGPVGLLASASTLEAEALTLGRAAPLVNGFSYPQGELVARLMFQLARHGEWPAHLFLAHVMKRLKEIPVVIRADYASRTLDMEEILLILLEGVPVNARACELLNDVMSKPRYLERFATCAR